MSETAHHLLIPFAAVSSALSSEAATKYLQDLKLPNLRQLLSTLTLVDSDIGAEESFSPPHERAIARLQGLPVARWLYSVGSAAGGLFRSRRRSHPALEFRHPVPRRRG